MFGTQPRGRACDVGAQRLDPPGEEAEGPLDVCDGFSAFAVRMDEHLGENARREDAIVCARRRKSADGPFVRGVAVIEECDDHARVDDQ